MNATQEGHLWANTKESPANDAEQQKQLEAKRDYYRHKYKLPEKLIRLIGCIPPHTDEKRELAKEEYLKEEKYLNVRTER